MSGISRFLLSSIGRKQVMAVTGLAFCVFITTHLLGNLMIYGGAEAFNGYAEKLHSLGPLVTMAELGLLAFAILHVGMAAILVYGNFAARPQRYAVNKNGGGRTAGSATMPYTGLILLVFVSIHLTNFTFIDKGGRQIFEIVAGTLSNPAYAAFYGASVLILGLHVSHGFWSAFQSFGLNHPKYIPAIKPLSALFAVVVAVGYASLPVYLFVLSKGGI